MPDIHIATEAPFAGHSRVLLSHLEAKRRGHPSNLRLTAGVD